jgi:hypothetical protein
MSNFLQADMLRGRKNIVVSRDGKLGEEVLLSDRSTPGIGPESSQTGMFVEAIIVKASEVLSSPAGKGVHFTAAGYGTIIANESASGEICDGIVDPDLTGNLAVDDTFLLYRRGPMPIIASAAIVVGPLKTANGGKFVAATTEDAPTRCGRLLVAASADGDARRAFMDFTRP